MPHGCCPINMDTLIPNKTVFEKSTAWYEWIIWGFIILIIMGNLGISAILYRRLAVLTIIGNRFKQADGVPIHQSPKIIETSHIPHLDKYVVVIIVLILCYLLYGIFHKLYVWCVKGHYGPLLKPSTTSSGIMLWIDNQVDCILVPIMTMRHTPINISTQGYRIRDVQLSWGFFRPKLNIDWGENCKSITVNKIPTPLPEVIAVPISLRNRVQNALSDQRKSYKLEVVYNRFVFLNREDTDETGVTSPACYLRTIKI